MREVLGLNDTARTVYLTPASSGQMLVSADMHGALVSVVRSRCVSRVGLEGIIVRDTQYTFDIITKKNVLKGKSRRHAGKSYPNLTGEYSDTERAHYVSIRDSAGAQGWRGRWQATRL